LARYKIPSDIFYFHLSFSVEKNKEVVISPQQKAQPFLQNSLCASCCSARQPFCCFTFPTLFSAHSFYFQLIKFSVEKNKNKELKMPLHTDKTTQS